MKIYFSESVYGFFHDNITKLSNMPSDVVELTNDFHQEVIVAMGQGKVLTIVNGVPTLIDGRKEATLTTDEKAASLRAQRNALLTSTDGMVSRHRDQKEASVSITLTDLQFTQLQQYRQALREFPEQAGFPNLSLPAKPDFFH